MSIHKVYGELNEISQNVVDEAFCAVVEVLKDNHRSVSYDDRAEKLVEAIAIYLKESHK